MDSSLKNRISSLKSSNGLASIPLGFRYEEEHISRLRSHIAKIESDKVLLVKVQGLLDRGIQVISANGIGKIESIVSGGLQLVFDDKTMRFVLEKKEGAKGISYRLLVTQNGKEPREPMDSNGHGLCNTVAFLLRVIMIKRFKLAKFLAVDETFANVSDRKGYVIRVSEMLKKLCKDHGYTILAITQNDLLASRADTRYHVVGDQGGLPQLFKCERDESGEFVVPED